MWEHDRHYSSRSQQDLRGRIQYPHYHQDYIQRDSRGSRDYYRRISRSRSRSRGRYRSRSRSRSRSPSRYYRYRRDSRDRRRSPPRNAHYGRPQFVPFYGYQGRFISYPALTMSRRYARPKTCDNCGSYEHLRAQCTEPLQCHACGAYDHVKNACPHTDKQCDLCGKVGHLRAKCHQAQREMAPAGAMGGRSRNVQNKTCDNCSEVGHLRATCPNPAECHACGGRDHVKADCPHLDKTCDNCGKVGHLKTKCHATNVSSGADGEQQARAPRHQSGAPKVCRNCASDQHLVAGCPNPKECNACGKTDHMKANCEYADSTCGICGRVGHLDVKCRQAAP